MTPRQHTAIKKIMESNGTVTIADAMREAKYAPSSINTPQVLTKSKAWEEVMEEQLDNDNLFTKHKEALEAKKIISSHTEPDYEYPDHAIRLKAVELAYRVKGRLKDGMNVAGDMVMNVTIIRNAENT
jgi:hypothetical protein